MIEDVQNKELVGYSWSSTASMRNLKQLFAETVNHKERVHKLDFIASLSQLKVKNRVFMKLDSRYADYFP